MKFLNDLLHLVYPNTCPSCEAELKPGEKAVCFSCLTDIEETDYHLAPRANELFMRFAGLVDIFGAAALFHFDKKDKLQRIIKALKYENLPQIGRVLGRWYGERLAGSDFVAGVKGLVPVPLHRSRFLERGYNQSVEIADGLSEKLGIPVVNTALVRAQKTATQTRKGREERWENMASVFRLDAPLPDRVLLVDDVITTGSTLVACVKAIEAAADRPEVGVVSIGSARKD